MAYGESLRLRKIRPGPGRVLSPKDFEKRGMIHGGDIAYLRSREDIPLRRERRAKPHKGLAKRLAETA